MPENKARTADRVKDKNVHGRIVVLTRSKPLTFPLCCFDQISCWFPRNTP